MDLWNNSNLRPPSTGSVRVELTQETREKFSKFRTVIDDSSRSLEEPLQLLSAETVFTSQFLYKLSAVFRNDKAVKSLKKCLKTAKSLLDIQLPQLLSNFGDQLNISDSASFFYGPNSAHLEHLLLRLQGASRLSAQLTVYAQQTGLLFLQKFYLGHFMNINTLSLACAARYWSVSLHILRQVVTAFTSLLDEYKSGVLPKSAVTYLPEDYRFPTSLAEWLISETDLDYISTMFTINNDVPPPLTEKKEPKFWQTLSVGKEDVSRVRSLLESKEAKVVPNIEDIDIGEAIPRSSATPSPWKKKKAQKNQGGKKFRH